jgi:DNA replication protein DnaC
LTSQDSKRCKCGGFGTLGFKQYGAYPTRDLTFCTCEYGERARADCIAADARKQQRLVSIAFANSGIPSEYARHTLDSWIQRAGKDADKQDAIVAARRWLDPHQQTKEGLFLYGNAGTGKTGLLAALFAATVSADVSGLWVEWFDFVASVQGKYGAADGSAQAAVEHAQRVPLLALDDLGSATRAQETDDRLNILYRVVNARVGNARPMLISSNLSPSVFKHQFTQRIWDRIQERCEVIRVGGANWRIGGAS